VVVERLEVVTEMDGPVRMARSSLNGLPQGSAI